MDRKFATYIKQPSPSLNQKSALSINEYSLTINLYYFSGHVQMPIFILLPCLV